MSEFAAGIADGLAALVLAIDPHAVVINSSWRRTAPMLVKALERELRSRTLFEIEVRGSKLAGEAPRFGALAAGVALVRDRIFDRAA